jgi:hypothetical protein
MQNFQAKAKQPGRWLTPMIALFALAAGASAAWAQGPDRYAITGDDVALYNLAGAVRIEGGSGSAVVVELRRGGRDAEQLRVETGRIEGRQTLRVLYPGDWILYAGLGRMGGSHTLQVRDDGTFYGKERRSGRKVTIGGSGIGRVRGLEAYADMTIRVPKGQRLAVYLAAGRADVANVDGELVVDVGSAPITVQRARGRLRLDTGSGRVSAEDVDGELEVDTGSGSVEVRRVRGEKLLVDTGSGSVSGGEIEVEKLDVDTGSGAIRLNRTRAAEIRLDTGSGGVDFELLSAVRTLLIDTGSGRVNLALPASTDARLEIDTGSGGISVDLPVQVMRKERSYFLGQLGEGSGRIKVDTGSGGVRVTSSDRVAAR